jgi:hypothetical protein
MKTTKIKHQQRRTRAQAKPTAKAKVATTTKKPKTTKVSNSIADRIFDNRKEGEAQKRINYGGGGNIVRFVNNETLFHLDQVFFLVTDSKEPVYQEKWQRWVQRNAGELYLPVGDDEVELLGKAAFNGYSSTLLTEQTEDDLTGLTLEEFGEDSYQSLLAGIDSGQMLPMVVNHVITAEDSDDGKGVAVLSFVKDTK